MLGFSQVLKPIKWQDFVTRRKKWPQDVRFEQVQRFILVKKIISGHGS